MLVVVQLHDLAADVGLEGAVVVGAARAGCTDHQPWRPSYPARRSSTPSSSECPRRGALQPVLRSRRRVRDAGPCRPHPRRASPGSACCTSSTSCRRRRTPQLSDGARREALRKLTFRALWWFRWARRPRSCSACSSSSVQDDGRRRPYFKGQHGIAILTGILFGVTMFLNVWGVIWRNQKIIIASAETVAAGGQADPDGPPRADKGAARASRCNTFFSHHHAVVHGVRRRTAAGSGRRRRPSRQHDRLLARRAGALGRSSRRQRSGPHRRPRQPVQQDRRSTTTRRRSSAASPSWPSSTSSAGSSSSPA